MKVEIFKMTSKFVSLVMELTNNIQCKIMNVGSQNKCKVVEKVLADVQEKKDLELLWVTIWSLLNTMLVLFNLLVKLLYNTEYMI